MPLFGAVQSFMPSRSETVVESILNRRRWEKEESSFLCLRKLRIHRRRTWELKVRFECMKNFPTTYITTALSQNRFLEVASQSTSPTAAPHLIAYHLLKILSFGDSTAASVGGMGMKI